MNTYQFTAEDKVMTFDGRKFALKDEWEHEGGTHYHVHAVEEGAPDLGGGTYPTAEIIAIRHDDGSWELDTICDAEVQDDDGDGVAGWLLWNAGRGVFFRSVMDEMAGIGGVRYVVQSGNEFAISAKDLSPKAP